MAKIVRANIPLKGISTGERKIKFDAEGFSGTECQTATEAFQNAIGTQTEEELKPEFYETEQRNEFLNNDG